MIAADHPERFRIFDEAWEILHAGRTLINTDASAWKKYGAMALQRYGVQPTESVARQVCLKLHAAQAQGAGAAIDKVQAEVLPLYLGLYEWAAGGFPHFTLCPDFFHAVAVTDFGDPTPEPLYMPFNSFTLSFPKTADLGMASRAFVYRIPSITPGGPEDFSYGQCKLDWRIYRATLMTEPTIITQWPIGMTRAELLDTDALAKTLSEHMIAVVNIRLREGSDSAVMRTTMEIDEILRPFGQKQKQKILGEILNESNYETPSLDSSGGKRAGAWDDIDDASKGQTSRLRLLLANVMSYIESAGPLPAVARKNGAEAAAVERIHKVQPNFEVGRVVKLDGNTRRALTLGAGDVAKWRLMQKFMVRGHWRNQVHGVGRALRRRQWIAPFYKGPDNVAEALSRTYEVA